MKMRLVLMQVFLTAEHSKADYGHESPGPVYDLKSSVGKQESSKNSTAPLFSFGTADRFHKDQAGGGKASSAPGPGTYVKPSSFGRQGESTRQTSEAFGFGSSTRLGAERVFLSPEHSKNDYGKSSPGPSVYNPKASVGQQAESHKENAPSFVFSSAERFKYEHVERAARMPGAGQYNAINSVGKQPDSKKSTLPRYSFGSSKREHRAKVREAAALSCGGSMRKGRGGGAGTGYGPSVFPQVPRMLCWDESPSITAFGGGFRQVRLWSNRSTRDGRVWGSVLPVCTRLSRCMTDSAIR